MTAPPPGSGESRSEQPVPLTVRPSEKSAPQSMSAAEAKRMSRAASALSTRRSARAPPRSPGRGGGAASPSGGAMPGRRSRPSKASTQQR